MFYTRHPVCILELSLGHCMNDLFGGLNIREIQNNYWVRTAICIIVIRVGRNVPAHKIFIRSILQTIPDDWLIRQWLSAKQEERIRNDSLVLGLGNLIHKITPSNWDRIRLGSSSEITKSSVIILKLFAKLCPEI